IEGQGLVDVTNLKRDMVQTHRASLLCLCHLRSPRCFDGCGAAGPALQIVHAPRAQSVSGQKAYGQTDYACPSVRSKAAGTNGMLYYLVNATNRLRALGLVAERGRLGRRGVNKAPPARTIGRWRRASLAVTAPT